MHRLFGTGAIKPYRLAFVIAIFVGAVTELEIVWTFADIMNGLMALPNLIGLILLSGLVARETKAYFAQPDWRKQG
jgi:alanine or glycine:cation symporter, AGCS family